MLARADEGDQRNRAAQKTGPEKRRQTVLGRSDLSAFAIAGFCFVANPLSAEEFPTRPVVIIVPSTPGGGTDIISRITGDQLSRQLSQPSVIQNVPGAGSVVGTAA